MPWALSYISPNLKMDVKDFNWEMQTYGIRFILASEEPLQLNGSIGPEFKVNGLTFANEGDFQISDSSGSELEVDGTLKLLNGGIDYLGNRLRLDQDAKNIVVFSSETNKGIYLDINTLYSVTDIVRNLKVDNTLNNMNNFQEGKITLSNVDDFGKGRVIVKLQGNLQQDKLEDFTEILNDDILSIYHNFGSSEDALEDVVFFNVIGKLATNPILIFRNISKSFSSTDLDHNSPTNILESGQGFSASEVDSEGIFQDFLSALGQKTTLLLLPTSSLSTELVFDINSSLSLSYISYPDSGRGLETEYGLDFHLSPTITATFRTNQDRDWKAALGFCIDCGRDSGTRKNVESTIDAQIWRLLRDPGWHP